MLASGLTCDVLTALESGPMQQADLLRATGSPAQTTMRAQLKRLGAIGVVVKQRGPGAAKNELTEAGKDLAEVVHVVEAWLARGPDGGPAMGTTKARAALKALAEAWSTTILRAIAAKPMALTDLSELISGINYPSIERRLASLRMCGLAEARQGNGRGTPYGVTDWLRQGMGPLAAASRWERTHLPYSTSPIGRVEVETGLLLSAPLLRLPDGVEGSCRMAVDMSGERKRFQAGVMVESQGGRIKSCTTRLEGYPDAWISGSSAAWLAAILEPDPGRLELGGDSALARSLLESLRAALFPKTTRNVP